MRVVVVTTVGEMIGDTVVVVVANEPPPPSNMAGEEEKVGGIWRLEVDDVKNNTYFFNCKQFVGSKRCLQKNLC